MENTKDQDQSKQGASQSEPMAQPIDGSGCESLDSAIIRQKIHTAQLEKLKAMREAARPLMEFLRNNYHLNCGAIVDASGVRIVEDQISVKF